MATKTKKAEAPWFAQYQVDVPEGEVGPWNVKRFTVTESDASLGRLRAMCNPSASGRFTPPGEYTGLYRGGSVVMSDTPDEIGDHLEPIRRARGHCLINGLGLGVVAQAMLRKPEVEWVTVIELSKNVIDLVADHYLDRFGGRFEIINDDAFRYQPPRGHRYGCVWHDIWSDICTDNLDGMKRLHRKYGRRTDWQGSWSRELCESYSRRGW